MFLARDFDVYYLGQTIIGKVRVRYRHLNCLCFCNHCYLYLCICYCNNNLLFGDRMTIEYRLLGLYIHVVNWYLCFKTFSLLVGLDQSLGACCCVRGHQQARWHLLT